jgi:muramidase (phage lysozyme)
MISRLAALIIKLMRPKESSIFYDAEPSAEEMYSTEPIKKWHSQFTPIQVKRIEAFLDMISHAEGTDRFGHDKGYNVLVGGTLFDSYEDHPRRSIWLPRLGIHSTAAGRYQILSRYWDHYKAQLNLPDFGHESQDEYAIQQLREQRALNSLLEGDVKTAIQRCANIWASFPNAGYGQREVAMNDLVRYYMDRLSA